MVILAELGDRGDLAGLTYEPAEQVEVVRALVEQDAAAFAFPGRTPAARVVVGLGPEPVGNRPVDAHDLADAAVFAETLDRRPLCEGALLEHAREDQV